MRGNLELDAAVLADLDGVEAYLVYADWLQQQGDRRGELAMVQAELSQRPADGLRRREAELLAGLGDLAGPDVELGWRLGWLHRAQLSRATAYAPLCGLDEARFLRELFLAGPGHSVVVSAEPFLPIMARTGVPFPLRRLGVQELPEQPVSDDLGGLWRRLDRLEELELFDFYTPVPRLGPPRLRWLTLHGDVSDERLDELGQVSWPRLERLSLRLAETDGTDGLATLLAAPGLPSLCKLALNEVPAGRRLAEVLARSPLLPRLQRLALPYGQLDDSEGELFLRHREAFAHLRSLDLRNNYFNRDMCSRLARLCPEVILDRQLPGEP